MSRFNTATISKPAVITNKAGGRAFKQSDKGELAAILLTNFLTDQFYRSTQETVDRIRELVAIDPLFAAKAAVFARDRFNMRSITHVVAGEIAMSVKGQTWTKDFFEKVVVRPDDMLETLGYIASVQGSVKPVPHAMRKGFGRALSGLDEYRLGKYKADGKGIKMRDLVNLVRPKSTPALDALMKGTLSAPETWEVKLTQAGGDAEAKAKVWRDLLTEDKLGYMALMRNLRNIRDQAPDMLDLALKQLTDGERIWNSRVLPFRFTTAIQQFMGAPTYSGYRGYTQEPATPADRKIVGALNVALDKALANVPVLPGNTAVLMDVSGSMGNMMTPNSPMAIGSLFAAVVAKVNNADLIAWATSTKHVNYNPGDSLHTIRQALTSVNAGGGTDLSQAIDSLKEKYDRVVIFSDFQSWRDSMAYYGSSVPATEAMKQYRQRVDSPDTKVFSFDLAGYGELQFPEKNVYTLAGFSEQVFDLMGLLEEDRKALEHAIEAVAL